MMELTLTVQSLINYAVRMDQMFPAHGGLLAFASGHLEGRICGGKMIGISSLGQLEISCIILFSG
jgi:hypothetical protein